MYFTAIILVCQLSIPIEKCDEATAIDMISKQGASELTCNQTGWQEVIARGSLKEDMEKNLYIKTLCRRSK